ncbi:MAG: DUF932 domain-containing protein [Jatrophihabitans sp.]|uniref:DUF932 domain-containing protein n=1 Tax=Jatrophihabitans sp. TaxID=1932789 RepID=UPI003914CF37
MTITGQSFVSAVPRSTPTRYPRAAAAVIGPDTNTILGVAGEGYALHQYRAWLLDNLARLLDDGLFISSAGLLNEGRIAWVELEAPENLVTKTGVAFRPHLLVCTSHDQSFASTYKRVQTVIVCDNTLALARGERGAQVKVRHTRNSSLNIATARDALQIVFDSGAEFAAEIDHLVDTTVTDEHWEAFLDARVAVPEAEGRARTMATSKHLQPSRPERTILRAIDGSTARADADALAVLARVHRGNV